MINIDSDNPITDKAFEVWGEKGQLAILQEEAAELISSVARFDRKRCDHRKVAEEMADLFVSAMSVIKALGIEDEIKLYMEFKLSRLQLVINKHERELKLA